MKQQRLIKQKIREAKMWRSYLVSTLILSNIFSYSQNAKSIDNAETIPLDPMVKVGKLQNGFTYYIRNSQAEKGKAAFRFIVKAGHQQDGKKNFQIAHLMEHIAIRSTKHFESPNSYFERKGIWPGGGDMWANTLDEYTLYHFNNFPGKDTGLVHDVLRFMRDMAHDVNMDSAAIETERGIVWAESESGANGELRVWLPLLDKIVGISGWEGVIAENFFRCFNSFQPEYIYNFYEKWYRPEHQGIVIVGDVDVDLIEQQVLSLFADLEPSPVPAVKAKYPPVAGWKNQVLTVASPLLKEVHVKVIMKRPYQPKMTRDDYKFFLKTELLNELFGARFRELEEDLPVASITSYYTNPFKGIRLLSALLTEFRLDRESGSRTIEHVLKKVMVELRRIKKFGFSKEEFELTKSTFIQRYLLKDVTNKSMASGYVNHFVTGESYPGPDEEKVLLEKLLKEITVKQVNVLADELIRDKNRDIIIMSPEKVKLPSEATVNRWLREVYVKPVNPYIAKKPIEADNKKHGINTQLMSDSELIKLAGDISFQKKLINSIGVTDVRLANGVRVLVKSIKGNLNERQRIYMRGFSHGGFFAYDEPKRSAAIIGDDLVVKSGLGLLINADFNELKKSKSMHVWPYIAETEEGIVGEASTADAELLLQSVYEYFVHPKVDENAALDLKKSLATSNMGSIDSKLTARDSIFKEIGIVWSNNIKKLVHTVDWHHAYEIYKERFNNGGDFTFVISGDFEVIDVIPLIAKYLGRLPAIETREPPVQVTPPIINKLKGRKVFYTRECFEPASIELLFAGQFENTSQNRDRLRWLQNALQILLYDRLRVAGGSTFDVTVNLNLNERGWYFFSIIFQCSTTKVEDMVSMVREEIRKLKESGPTEEIKNRVSALATNKINKDTLNTSFWQNYLIDRVKYNEDISLILNIEQQNNQLTAKNLAKYAEQYLREDCFYEIISLPVPCK